MKAEGTILGWIIAPLWAFYLVLPVFTKVTGITLMMSVAGKPVVTTTLWMWYLWLGAGLLTLALFALACGVLYGLAWLINR